MRSDGPQAAEREGLRRLPKELRLLLDTLELTGKRRLLVAALAYRRHALPIRWRYVEAARVTKAHDFGPVPLVYPWAEGEGAPGRLVTSLEAGFEAVRYYRRRMWGEELFGDLQDGGSHLSQSRIYRPNRLSRLVLGLSLTYVWLVAVASYVVKRGWRRLVDRTEFLKSVR